MVVIVKNEVKLVLYNCYCIRGVIVVIVYGFLLFRDVYGLFYGVVWLDVYDNNIVVVVKFIKLKGVILYVVGMLVYKVLFSYNNGIIVIV